MDLLPAARVAAVFSSGLSAAGRDPTADELEAAIRLAVRRCGGVRGCYAEMAEAYGDHPSAAVERARWARRIVASAYPSRMLQDA
jgi:propanediol dehydratase large subunit